MVIIDDPNTRNASHPFAASIALSALSLGTLSPKKITFKVTMYDNGIKTTTLIDFPKYLKNYQMCANGQNQENKEKRNED
jgi:hypothetical protein